MMRIDCPSFADPVADAQAVFRALLDATAHPGRMITLAGRLDPPSPLCRATAALLLTLADADTTLALPADADPARDFLAFHTGAGFGPMPQADFVVAQTLPVLGDLHDGTDEEPESGATLIVDLPSLAGGTALRLRGPGIAETTTIDPPLADGFPRWWHENHRRFPRGVDLVLCAGDSLIALPRSVTVEAG